MFSQVFISVIIPTYHDWRRLQICLDALKEQTFPKERFEIIVVNNAPEDLPPLNLECPENCTILEEEKPGSYAARNKALSKAKGNFYAFTDSDCQPQKDWLETGVTFLLKNPKIARVGGNIKLLTQGLRPTYSETYEKAFAFRQEEFVRVKGMAATANMISRSAAFEKVGFFNSALLSGGDAEWGIRANANGLPITFVEECIVWHPTRSTLSELIQKTKREAGGHHRISPKKGLALLLEIALGVIPPLRSGYNLIRRNDMKASEKAIAFFLRYLLRLCSSLERTLLCFGKDAERV